MKYLSDNAYACDPRIQRFKDEEKEKKLAQKKAKQDAARQKQEEEERVSSNLQQTPFSNFLSAISNNREK